MSFSYKDFAPHAGVERRYPIDEVDQYKSRITFQVMKVIPPRFNVQFSSNKVEGGSDGGFELNKESASLSAVDVKPIPGEKTDLYLPIAFQVNDRAEYGNASLGATGAAAAAAMNAGASIPSSVFEGIKQAGQSFVEAFKLLGGEGVTGLGAARIAQIIPNDKLSNATTLSARVILNPNVRTLFNGVAIREFTFQFQFQPKSRKEAIAVKDIIKYFRYHMYPEEISGQLGSADIPLGFKYPNMFRIKLLSNIDGPFKNIGTPIKLSYLRSVSTSYNNQSGALHADGSPTDINLSLSFVEYKTISKIDIRNEENDIYYQHEFQKSETRPSNAVGDF